MYLSENSKLVTDYEINISSINYWKTARVPSAAARVHSSVKIFKIEKKIFLLGYPIAPFEKKTVKILVGQLNVKPTIKKTKL